MRPAPTLPPWADRFLLPPVCLLAALVVAGIVSAAAGQDPGAVLQALLRGAFGTLRGFSYTLYYSTTFVFTGLSVALALHAGLFNIGAEGQATLGGLCMSLLALWLAPALPAWQMLPLMVLAGVAGGILWALVPGYMQAYRGSHVVITTIMMNFIASTLMVYVLVNHLRGQGGMRMESASFAPSARLPDMQSLLALCGVAWPASPLNASWFLALLAACLVYGFLWRSRAGYRLRVAGASSGAADYAGINRRHQVLLAMALSGALSGLVGLNELAGVNGKLMLDFTAGAGFTGIAVALMGRNHPLGIVLAAVLFGALYQGGTEVAFDVPGFTRDMVVMLQGFIVLFSGAMSYVIAPWLARLLQMLRLMGVAHG